MILMNSKVPVNGCYRTYEFSSFWGLCKYSLSLSKVIACNSHLIKYLKVFLLQPERLSFVFIFFLISFRFVSFSFDKFVYYAGFLMFSYFGKPLNLKINPFPFDYNTYEIITIAVLNPIIFQLFILVILNVWWYPLNMVRFL